MPIVRADAARNRAAILDHARRLIAERGADVTIDEIAQAAGLAVGTLYRHHPTKAHLVEAVVAESTEQIADRAEQAAAAVDHGADPGVELASLFRDIAQRSRTDRAVKQAATSLGARTPDVEAALGGSSDDTPTTRAVDAVGRVLASAQSSGAIRSDVVLADLLLIVESLPATADPDVLDRYLDIILSGLRA